jgi:hypothetical protein
MILVCYIEKLKITKIDFIFTFKLIIIIFSNMLMQNIL